MIYADSGIIMRWIEGAEEVRAPIQSRWQQLSPEDRVFLTSRLSRLECRCKPLREQQGDLLSLYDAFFAGKEVTVREVDAAVVEKATELRATIGLKTPDAIHAATAIVSGVAAFWTTDAAFSKCPELIVEVFTSV